MSKLFLIAKYDERKSVALSFGEEFYDINAIYEEYTHIYDCNTHNDSIDVIVDKFMVGTIIESTYKFMLEDAERRSETHVKIDFSVDEKYAEFYDIDNDDVSVVDSFIYYDKNVKDLIKKCCSAHFDHGTRKMTMIIPYYVNTIDGEKHQQEYRFADRLTDFTEMEDDV
jgi:hypothetical protein